MTNIRKVLGLLGLAVLMSLPALAQSRGGGTSQRGTPGGAPSAPAAPSVGVASSAPVVSSSSSSSRDYSGMRSYGTSGGSPSGGGGYYIPNLEYTSFNSIGNYFQWRDFCMFLQMRYYMNQAYFSRFYRQSEPLMTPELLKLTMRQPLRLSMQLLEAIDSLESTLKEGEAGKPVDKAAVASKTQEIRELAKKIRGDQALAFFDQRRDKDTLKLDKVDSLSPEATAQLREVATDLNTQLKGMYTQTSTSTVSVQSLSAPSFESLTKGIDKLAKAIENSAHRM